MVCVGLDPDIARIPADCAASGEPLLPFFEPLIDATAPFTAAFKPQIAHFAALAAESELARLIDYIHTKHPQIPVILDAKRGDIGSTAERYAAEAFERYDADAVTVNPYMGWEAIEPFARHRDRGVIVLCRTSNPGSDWLQQRPADDPPYLRVAASVADWNEHGNLGLVAGATYPAEIGRIREQAPELPILVPGIGAQGGDLAAVLRHGLDDAGGGLIISSSRGIIYAHETDANAGGDWAAAAGAAAETLQFQIDEIRRGQGPGIASDAIVS